MLIMPESSSIKQMALTVEELRRLARELYDTSCDFPAVNRNARRILASVEMLRINLEDEREE
jgi:hypothetical protein